LLRDLRYINLSNVSETAVSTHVYNNSCGIFGSCIQQVKRVALYGQGILHISTTPHRMAVTLGLQ
jgi:hypothetical protein